MDPAGLAPVSESGPHHLWCHHPADEVNPSSARDSSSRVFQRRGYAAGCWKSSFPRQGSGDCGSSALGDRQLLNSSQRVPLPPDGGLVIIMIAVYPSSNHDHYHDWNLEQCYVTPTGCCIAPWLYNTLEESRSVI